MKKSGKVEHEEIEGSTSNGEETQQMEEKEAGRRWREGQSGAEVRKGNGGTKYERRAKESGENERNGRMGTERSVCTCGAGRVASFDFVVGLDRWCYHDYGGSTAVLHC